jgi:hypothetical protein
VGSTTIVLHAPQEREIESVAEVWDLATEPGFILHSIRLHSNVDHHCFHVEVLACCYLSTILRLDLLSCSVSSLCRRCACSSFRAHIPFCPAVWSDTYYGVYWRLFSCWVFVGMFFTSLIIFFVFAQPLNSSVERTS